MTWVCDLVWFEDSQTRGFSQHTDTFKQKSCPQQAGVPDSVAAGGDGYEILRDATYETDGVPAALA